MIPMIFAKDLLKDRTDIVTGGVLALVGLLRWIMGFFSIIRNWGMVANCHMTLR